MFRIRCAVLGAITLLCLGHSSFAQWTPFTLSVDSSLTSMTLSGGLSNDDNTEFFPFQEQVPGSLTAAGKGTIAIELFGSPGAYTQIRFPGGSVLQPVLSAASFEPGNAPADFAAFVDLNGTIGNGAFRNDTLDLTNVPAPIDVLGNYSTLGLNAQATTGTFYYDLPGVISGNYNYYFNSSVEQPLIGNVSIVGNQLHVSIPYSGGLTYFEPAIGLNFTYAISGTIVGNVTLLPEPASGVLAAVGMLLMGGCAGVARRASRA